MRAHIVYAVYRGCTCLRYTLETWGWASPKGVAVLSFGFPFYALQLSDWFSLMQNKACTHHQLGKGMQAVALLRLISEEGCFGGVFSCQKVSLLPSASSLSARLPAVAFLVATFLESASWSPFLPNYPPLVFTAPLQVPWQRTKLLLFSRR